MPRICRSARVSLMQGRASLLVDARLLDVVFGKVVSVPSGARDIFPTEASEEKPGRSGALQALLQLCLQLTRFLSSCSSIYWFRVSGLWVIILAESGFKKG